LILRFVANKPRIATQESPIVTGVFCVKRNIHAALRKLLKMNKPLISLIIKLL